MVEIGECEAVALYDGHLRHLNAVDDAAGVHVGRAGDEGRQPDLLGQRLHALHLTGTEHGKSVVVAEVDDVVVGVHTHAVEVFLLVQSVAVDVPDELLARSVVLPEAHRGGAPDVAVVRLYDVADHLVAQGLAAREEPCAALLAVVEIESALGAHDDVAVGKLAERETHDAVEQLLPALSTEALGLRVEAGDARGCTHPYHAIAVGHHAHHPVVAELSRLGRVAAGVVHAVVLKVPRLLVVDAEAARERGYVDIAGVVAGHIVKAVTVEGDLLSRGSRQRVVGKETVVGAYPVLAPAVAEDKLNGIGSLGMSHDMALSVEAVDTHTLDGTPRHAAVALADRGDRRAETDALCLEAPVMELHGPLGYAHKTLALQSEPEVSRPVGEDAPYLGGVEVGADDVDSIAFQPVAAPDDAEHATSARTYIYSTMRVLAHTTEEHVAASEDAHVEVAVGTDAVVIGHDAAQTDDEHLVVALDDAHRLALRREIAELAAVLHQHGVVIARLPETAAGVLENVAVKVVMVGVGKVVGSLQPVVIAHGEGTVACRSHKDTTVGKLYEVADTGPDTVGKNVVDKAVGTLVVAVQSPVGAHPEPALPVAEQTDHGIVADAPGVVVAVKEHLELVAVMAVQAIVGGYPEIAVLVLADVSHKTA